MMLSTARYQPRTRSEGSAMNTLRRTDARTPRRIVIQTFQPSWMLRMPLAKPATVIIAGWPTTSTPP
jgi:hypothetical protein